MPKYMKSPHGLKTCEPFENVQLAGERFEGNRFSPAIQHRAALFRAEARELDGASKHAALALAAHFSCRAVTS